MVPGFEDPFDDQALDLFGDLLVTARLPDGLKLCQSRAGPSVSPRACRRAEHRSSTLQWSGGRTILPSGSRGQAPRSACNLVNAWLATRIPVQHSNSVSVLINTARP